MSALDDRVLELERELEGLRRTRHGEQVALKRTDSQIRGRLAALRKLKPTPPPVDIGSPFIPDTSEWTGPVDWPGIASGNCRRGACKATQYRVDGQFERSWQQMRSLGFLSRGAYHYFTEEPALVQAERLLAAVHNAGGLDLPYRWLHGVGPVGDWLAVDFEQAYAAAAATRAELELLVNELRNRIGPRVLLYTGGPFWNQATGGWQNDLGCTLWHAAYVGNPDAFLPAAWHSSAQRLWQFTDGKLGNRPHGITGINFSDLSIAR